MSLLKEVKSDKTEKVMELLQSPQDLNVKDNKTGNSLLHFAIENQNMTILNALLALENKPNLNVLNNEDVSPLAYAAMLNFIDAMEPLLKHGADPNFCPPEGRTALHYAAVTNLREAVKILLKHGADINKANEEGSALHIATRESNDDVALLLMENPNINFFATDSEGNTFLHISVQYGAYNIFQKFFTDLENGVYTSLKVTDLLNKTNQNGNTLFHEAEIHKRLSISQFLKQNTEKFNLNPSAKNKDGFTAEDCKNQNLQKAKEEEEMKKLKKEEAKEIRKQRKIETDQLNEERRKQEIIMRKKEKEEEQRVMEAMKNAQKKKPLISIAIVMALLTSLYYVLSYGIQKKKDKVLDL